MRLWEGHSIVPTDSFSNAQVPQFRNVEFAVAVELTHRLDSRTALGTIYTYSIHRSEKEEMNMRDGNTVCLVCAEEFS